MLAGPESRGEWRTRLSIQVSEPVERLERDEAMEAWIWSGIGDEGS